MGQEPHSVVGKDNRRESKDVAQRDIRNGARTSADRHQFCLKGRGAGRKDTLERPCPVPV
jgi:hypothetical protein